MSTSWERTAIEPMSPMVDIHAVRRLCALVEKDFGSPDAGATNHADRRGGELVRAHYIQASCSIVPRIPRAIGVVFASGAVLTSAAAMVAISRSPGQSWLAFFALIPLLQVIRTSSIKFSTSMGALWGVGLLGMLALTRFPGVRLSVETSGLLIIVPAAFALGASFIVRRIGFNPFVIAVAWTLVELALRPVGLPLGLAAGAVGSGALMSWIGGALGYILVAFLVIWANSAILSILNRVCISLPMPIAHFAILPTIRTAACEPAFAPIRNDSICIARPRAPPEF